MFTLVIGAAKSGKSEWAEILARRSQQNVIYIATARHDPGDKEWQAKIALHKLRRPPEWQTLEVPYTLAETIQQFTSNREDRYLLIDSLGTWLANCLDRDEPTWHQTASELLEAVKSCPASITIVAEEVGWGVVPAYESGRQFRDRLGALSRNLGAIADIVYLVTGGHALNLTAIGDRLPPN
ncbi:bifunctional adenosylcobinamide kinase/adenosylcobinamide-phosphate guanylyltransferase [Pseudanabaena sp. PCC 6802]|uniref:bifunctional adenosylcobinamide kinase/adenosylcobinamide-phosphate guanylyltransferase n=1 Tax=Pseudanabaena sp. PCC 6802 TaxID=118173 RepID=UPI000346B7F7|nr:bifunctional adenosylcobinamide kinase/adenosylcobinamide-phosphate guanylyltransferase [Pseudanabaena sp. PCC 6802]